MALRNYMYAKHIDDSVTKARINMVDTSNPDSAKIEASINRLHHHSHCNKEKVEKLGAKQVRHRRRRLSQTVAEASSQVKPNPDTIPRTISSVSPTLSSSSTSGCGSGREISLEDGTKVCRNCPDCDKKKTPVEELHFPKVNIEVQEASTPMAELQRETEKLSLDTTNSINSIHTTEIDFTNVF